VEKTYYIRDAQGNVMSIYTLIPEEVVAEPLDYDLRLTERDIYGSSRLGTENINQVIASTTLGHININTDLTQVVGDKHYELSNHLGNVLQVVTDRKLALDNGVYDPETGLYSSATEDGIVDYYTSDVVSQSDYYPFGMLLPGRNSSEEDYRYGFNGMEMDDEVHEVKGSSYDFGARLYNPRVGRWLSRDQLERNYPSVSSYNYCMNNPVILVDPDGKSPEPPVRLYIWSGNNNKSYETGLFERAAVNMVNIHKVIFGTAGLTQLKQVNSGEDIVSFINSQADNSIESIDYFGHGGSAGLYFPHIWEAEPPGSKELATSTNEEDRKKEKKVAAFNNLYKDEATLQTEENMSTNPVQRSMSLDDINPAKFTDNARIEIHGCSVAGEDFVRNANDNFAISASQKLFNAGKKNAVVIGHVGEAGYGDKEPPDYRLKGNTRKVFWNGNLVLQTRQGGHIEQDAIDAAIKNFQENGTVTQVDKNGR
jgi:RHS repeat-associated protein